MGGPKSDIKPTRPPTQQHIFQQLSTPTTVTVDGLHAQLTTSNIDNGFKPIILPQRMPTLVMTPNVTTILASPPQSTSNEATTPQLLDNQNKEISLASMLKIEINSGEDNLDKVESEIPSNAIYVPSSTASMSVNNSEFASASGQKTKRYKCEMCPYETGEIYYKFY